MCRLAHHALAPHSGVLPMSILFPFSRGPRLRPGLIESNSMLSAAFSKPSPIDCERSRMSLAMSAIDRGGSASLNMFAFLASLMNSGGAVAYDVLICSLSSLSFARSLNPSASSS